MVVVVPLMVLKQTSAAAAAAAVVAERRSASSVMPSASVQLSFPSPVQLAGQSETIDNYVANLLFALLAALLLSPLWHDNPMMGH